jgi:hypothetical protein
VRDALPLEVPLLGDVPVTAHEVDVLGRHDARHLGGAPDEVLPFLALAVRIGRRVEPTCGVAQVAQHVVEGVLDDAPEARIAGHLVRLEIQTGYLGVVVEHLLEVRHEPVGVDRVAMEAAPDLVVHAAARHPLAGEDDRLEQRRVAGGAVLAQEELERRRMRELRRAAESAFLTVDVREEALGGAAWQAGVQLAIAAPDLLGACQPREQLVDGLRDLVGSLAVGARDRLEHPREARHAVTVDRREVRAAVERLAVRGEEDRHRPSAPSREHLDGLHVHVVDVRALLPVDLHVDEPLVHEPCDVRVLERLPFHHVAPVAGGVADGQEDGTVLASRPREGLLSPGVPVDRVVGVLKQVWARLAREPVRRRHPGIVSARSGRRNAAPRLR